MTRPKIGVLKVYDQLVKVVEQDPERFDRRAKNNQPPVYVHHGEPVCLTACVMGDLGVPLTVLKVLDREEKGPGSIQLLGTGTPLRKRFTGSAWQLMIYMQRYNDRGWSWSSILRQLNTDIRRIQCQPQWGSALEDYSWRRSIADQLTARDQEASR